MSGPVGAREGLRPFSGGAVRGRVGFLPEGKRSEGA